MTKKAKRRPVTPATLHWYVVWYMDQGQTDLAYGATIEELLTELANRAVSETNRR